MKWEVFGVVFLIGLFSFVSADILSVNSGGDDQLIVNPDNTLENFFFSFNSAPTIFNVVLSSSSGQDITSDNLSVTYDATDPDDDALTNISDWRIGGNSIVVLNLAFDSKKNSGTTRDYSTNENNMTVNAKWISSGQVGGAYDFNGSGAYLVTSDDNSLDLTGNLTIEAWVKPGTNANNLAVVHKFGGGYSGYRFGASQTSISFGYGNSTGGYESFSRYGLSLSGWSHIAVIKDGHSVKLYLNGAEVSSGTSVDSVIATSTADLYVGRNPWNAAWFNGSIDEVKIFDRALSEEQLRVEYNAGLNNHQVEKMVSQETVKGETWTVAMTANDGLRDSPTVISNSLTIGNLEPYDPSPTLVSVDGSNESDVDLNCSTLISDLDSDTLGVYVDWIKDGSSQFVQYFSNQENGSLFSAILDSGNLTLGDVWKCSVRVEDEEGNSSWVDSNEVEIIDITDPIVYIISPESINYTTLNVTFNVSVVENENTSVCLYSLDGDPNVTMNRLNDTYFWYAPSLGPGPHDVWFYCNDTSGNWGSNYTNFTIDNEAAIAILLSDLLSWKVEWNIETLPINDLPAIGNNGTNATDYYVNISATNTLVDLYVKADGDLYTVGGDVIPLENENFTYSSTDPNVTGVTPVTMNTSYILIGSGLGDNSTVYLKFFLDAPASQAAGNYSNQLDFKAVRQGETP